MTDAKKSLSDIEADLGMMPVENPAGLVFFHRLYAAFLLPQEPEPQLPPRPVAKPAPAPTNSASFPKSPIKSKRKRHSRKASPS